MRRSIAHACLGPLCALTMTSHLFAAPPSLWTSLDVDLEHVLRARPVEHVTDGYITRIPRARSSAAAVVYAYTKQAL